MNFIKYGQLLFTYRFWAEIYLLFWVYRAAMFHRGRQEAKTIFTPGFLPTTPHLQTNGGNKFHHLFESRGHAQWPTGLWANGTASLVNDATMKITTVTTAVIAIFTAGLFGHCAPPATMIRWWKAARTKNTFQSSSWLLPPLLCTCLPPFISSPFLRLFSLRSSWRRVLAWTCILKLIYLMFLREQCGRIWCMDSWLEPNVYLNALCRLWAWCDHNTNATNYYTTIKLVF